MGGEAAARGTPAAWALVVTTAPDHARRANWWAALLLAVAVGWHLAPLYTPPFASEAIVGSDTYRSHDWLEVAKLDFYARKSLLQWHSLPLWNPLLAGGQPQFSHPSDGSMGPLILASVLFGEVLGMKINVGLAALLGAWGVLFLLRSGLGLGISAAFVGALGYAWSGWLPARVAVGFYESSLVVAWPAVLALWLMPGPLAARRRRWTLAAVVVWALSVQLQLFLPVLVLLMVVLWAAAAVQDRRRGQPIDVETAIGGALVLAVAGLLGAVKFLPMLHFLGVAGFRETGIYPQHPDAWYFSFQQLWYGLFHHVPPLRLVNADGHPRVQEYITMMPGLGVLLLAVIGLPAALRRGHPGVVWCVAAAVFAWLSFGPYAPVDGFRLLRQLPLFSSMRGPLRYFNYPVLLALCVLAAVGFGVLHHLVQKGLRERSQRLRTLAQGALLLLAVAGLLGVATDVRELYRSSFLYAAEPLPAQQEFHTEGLRRKFSSDAQRDLRVYRNVLRDVPTVYRPQDIPIQVGAQPKVWLAGDGSDEMEPAYRGEAWVQDPGVGSARLVSLRGQEVIVEHSLPGDGVVVVNQNYMEGWDCGGRALATDVVADLGVLAFVAPAGSGQRTVCTWTPPGFAWGLLGSTLGFLALLGLWPWRSE